MTRQIVGYDPIAVIRQIFRKSGIALPVLCHAVHDCHRALQFSLRTKYIVCKSDHKKTLLLLIYNVACQETKRNKQ
jgi:hypothetical protein